MHLLKKHPVSSQTVEVWRLTVTACRTTSRREAPAEGPTSHGKCAEAADDKLENVQNSGIHQANSSNESDVEIDPYGGFLVLLVLHESELKT